jgi:arylformamidase
LIDQSLEYQYNARAAVPGYDQIFDRWKAGSEAFRGEAECRLNIGYGPHPRETLDLFLSGGGRGLHLFLHGGYWQALDKSYFSFIAEGLVQKGVDVAVCNYPLCPEISIAGILKAVQRACLFLWRNARRFGADGSRLTLSGHSAGGQLTAMLMATPWQQLAPELPAGLCSAGVAISGLYDLEPLLHTTINRKLGLDRESARNNSPIYTQPVCRAPMLLVVGSDERPAFHRQMELFSRHRRGQELPVETLVVPGSNHFTVVEGLADPHSRLFESVLALTAQQVV